ncbi:helix-hairpin-helix domain-containing protein [Paludibacter sp.]|uniref:ComEA family DNA-binding protein n=1 Tax=Paludibacter sp. TaxID=1898105 RepID=UPI001352C8F3|nr:helix-hairpin-helix domain-containing protein [Paludibacter sp.]MTK52359.1 helix-hairpin-helix domain-containing protein [Paludibacter sp.]
MWKDWFFFSRSQQIGIIILIVIILALLAARMILPALTTHTVKKDNFETEANIFLDSLKSAPHGNYPPSYHYNNYAENRHESAFDKLPKPVLSRFNPNTADSIQFVRLGIKPKIASNILKYRKKGGKFRKAEDFQKIWGINEEQMQTLLHYIDIPAETPPPVAATTYTKTTKTDAVVELNSADSTILKQVKGIGSGFARRIVGYRKRLGGFVRIDQLREVWGITPEMYAALAPHFSIDKKYVQTINVNKASIERLKYHPYLNFYTAKAIYELRLTRGSLKSINDLKTIDILDKDLIYKIEPYLSFL